jgi:hypothetical protein
MMRRFGVSTAERVSFPRLCLPQHFWVLRGEQVFAASPPWLSKTLGSLTKSLQ